MWLDGCLSLYFSPNTNLCPVWSVLRRWPNDIWQRVIYHIYQNWSISVNLQIEITITKHFAYRWQKLLFTLPGDWRQFWIFFLYGCKLLTKAWVEMRIQKCRSKHFGSAAGWRYLSLAFWSVWISENVSCLVTQNNSTHTFRNIMFRESQGVTPDTPLGLVSNFSYRLYKPLLTSVK